MVINKDSIKLLETMSFNIPEPVLVKIEDSLRKDQELLVTIDASHLGFRNGNGTIYRHDTLQDDIHTFVYPHPKPIIEKHRLKTSEKYGSIIAADLMLTDFYNQISNDVDLEGLSTHEYISMCKDHILPFQARRSDFNGLAFVQVVGKIDHKGGIKRIIDKEFFGVSIGAAPKRLICSECLQDQTTKICNHYARKGNGVFMLAESLEYEELSFVDKPADRFGKVIKIHDGIEEVIHEYDASVAREANIDVVYIKDFFKQAEGKKIVCVNNICAIINQEEEKMEKITLSLIDEFTAEVVLEALKGIKLEDEQVNLLDSIKLSDEETASLTSRQFAIVQKTGDNEKRRFPLNNEFNVRAGLSLIDKAEDLTESEVKKAKAKLEKAAEKFNIKIEDSTEETTEVVVAPVVEETTETQETSKLEKILDELKGILEEEKKVEVIEDCEETTSPKQDAVIRIFNMLKWFSTDLAIAGKSLNESIRSFLEDQGEKAIASGMYDELQEKATKLETIEVDLNAIKTDNETLKSEVLSLNDELEILEENNKELNYELRVHLVDELITSKIACDILQDEEAEAEKENLMKIPYNALMSQVKDFRKMTAKLKDSVNNRLEIRTVPNPTLQDSMTEETQMPLETKKKDSKQLESDLVRSFVNLFRN